MHYLLLFAAVPSALISWAMVYVVRRAALRRNFVDKPDATRKGHAKVTPLGGGIAIWLGVISTFAVGISVFYLVTNSTHDRFRGSVNQAEDTAASLSRDGSNSERFAALTSFLEPHLAGIHSQLPKLIFLLGSATLMMLLGLWDDVRHLDWRLRLLIQTAIADWVVSNGFRMSLFLDSPNLSFALSVIWIVGIVNSFNMLDNMDGLSAGVALIGAFILGLVMLTAPNPESQGPQLFVAGFLFVLVGALKGFLWHNSPPATIFMGDAGSYFVGFLIATSTLMATFAGEGLPRHAILAPLCILAVPMYDTFSVVLIRLREGRSPFHADASHFSHRLVALGLSRKQAVWLIYLLTMATGIGALLLHQVNLFGACVILVMVVCVLVVIAVLESIGNRNIRR